MSHETALRILIVEDVPSDAEIILHELRRNGISVEATRVDTETAFLTALHEFRPDLILSDYRMPNFNGLTALRLAKERTSNIPFLIVTGSINEETAVECLKAGATNYILKEHLQRLGQAVRSALEQKRISEDRERFAAALKESEEKYRLLVENANEVIVVAQDFRLCYVNPKAVETFGLSQEDLAARPFREFIHPDDRDRVVENYTKRIAGEGVPSSYEFRIITKSGAFKWMEIRSVRIEWKGAPATLNFMSDVTERKAAEDRLRTTLAEREALLREIHHRVKNSLQVVISMISLQAQEAKQPQVQWTFQKARDRIKAMSLVHEHLSRSENLSHIEFGSQVQSLVVHLWNSYRISEKDIRADIHCQRIFLDINAAIPCSLLIGEIISNALVHAFPRNRRGTITVDVSESSEGHIDIVIRDDGVGLPENVDTVQPVTFGFQAINLLVGQLEAEMTIVRKEGTEFRISFHPHQYAERV